MGSHNISAPEVNVVSSIAPVTPETMDVITMQESCVVSQTPL